MKINSISIENIGAHKSTQIDFNGLPATVAITGQNGTGKTFLIEAVPACLYGAFPTRPGSIYDRITNGFEGKAEIKIEFQMNDEFYSAIRILKKRGKTTTSEAHLYILGEVPSLIAGPKVKDFDQAVVNLLGPQSSFLASVFSSQKNTGDVCDARPAERKAVFANLIGLERFDKISEASKEKAKTMEAVIATQELNIRGMKERAAGLKQAQDELKTETKAHKDTTYWIDSKKIEIENLEARMKEGEVALGRWKVLNDQRTSLDAEIAKLQAEVESDRVEYKRLKKIVDRSEDICKAELDLEKAMTRKDKLQAELQEIERDNANKRETHNKRRSDFDLVTSELKAQESIVKRLKDQASLLDKTPKQECCNECSLVASAVKAKSEIPTALKKLSEVRDKIDPLGKIPTLKLNEIAIPASQLREKTEEILKLKKLTADSAELREAQGSMKTMTSAGILKVKTIAGKTAERDKVSKEVIEALKLCPDKELKTECLQAKMDRGDQERKLSDITSAMGALKERILSMADAANKADEAEKEITGTREKVSDLRDIERAFGRSGIQPLIIEQARPELEEIADQMLGTATNGKMRVRFETQKELKSGDMVESLDIVVSRDGFDLDISEFSGGEQKVIRTAVRLTLAVWQARRGGNRLRTIFLDEVFDSLDQENSALMLGLIESLKNQFDRILLISHDDDLLEDCPAKICLTKNGVVQEW